MPTCPVPSFEAAALPPAPALVARLVPICASPVGGFATDVGLMRSLDLSFEMWEPVFERLQCSSPARLRARSRYCVADLSRQRA